MTDESPEAIAEGCADLARRIPSRDALREAVAELERLKSMEVVKLILGEREDVT